jgi:hypothetical protein
MNNANSGEIRKGSPSSADVDHVESVSTHFSRGDQSDWQVRISSYQEAVDDRSATEEPDNETETIAEILFGHPVLPLEAFAFGRRMGRRMKRLFPGKLPHVLEGVCAGFEEVEERDTAQSGGGVEHD